MLGFSFSCLPRGSRVHGVDGWGGKVSDRFFESRCVTDGIRGWCGLHSMRGPLRERRIRLFWPAEPTGLSLNQRNAAVSCSLSVLHAHWCNGVKAVSSCNRFLL